VLLRRLRHVLAFVPIVRMLPRLFLRMPTGYLPDEEEGIAFLELHGWSLRPRDERRVMAFGARAMPALGGLRPDLAFAFPPPGLASPIGNCAAVRFRGCRPAPAR